MIISNPWDYHALVVDIGLRKLGVNVDWWRRSDYPRNELLSIHQRGRSPALKVKYSDINIKINRYSAVWNRRGGEATCADSIHPSDKLVVITESNQVLASTHNLLESRNPKALLVNSRRSKLFADQKIIQLDIAKKVGFNIPDTLTSNDPDEINKFARTFKNGIIGKLAFPFSWYNTKGNAALIYTTRIPKSMLRRAGILKKCPMIYQEFLEIDFEVRIIGFGTNFFAIKRSRVKRQSDNVTDVRDEYDTPSQIFVLPRRLEECCKNYMDAMDLNFAAFDVAHLRSGKYIFLEANESGQFLFLEHEHPELPILDAFCKYLGEGNKQMQYCTKGRILHLSEISESEVLQKCLKVGGKSYSPSKFAILES